MRLSNCHNFHDFRELARRRLPGPIFNYIDGAADDEVTHRRNTASFERCDLVPNVLRGVESVDISVTVMGQKLATPFYCSPTALQRLFHHDGERAVAAAASKFGTMFGVSSLGTVSVEELRKAYDTPQVYQFYFHKDRSLNRAMLQRAKTAGVNVMMLTVDSITGGNRERDLRTGFSIPFRLTLGGMLEFARRPAWGVNYMTHERFRMPQLDEHVDMSGGAMSIGRYFTEMLDPSMNWEDVAEMVRLWDGQFCLKETHCTWRLVRSVRVGRRVIQQTVAHLGELDEHGRIEARALARQLIGAPEQAALFDDGSRDVAVPVRLKGIRLERSRQFGDVYLALALWRGVGLAELCEELLPAGKERIAREKIAVVLVAARLCAPSSELHIAEDWYRRTALADLLQLDEVLLNKDRLYRALDQLVVHKAAIEAHLSRRAGELFALDNEVLLYDVTSTYFEGQAEANALAQRGYSRDHRSDCKQVPIALVVTFDGFPLGYEVFAGNTHDSKTLQTIVATMEARHGMLGRVWIADRGMASRENLAWLRETGRRYIIGAPKSELKKFADALAAPAGWREVRAGIAVKLARCPETGETVILCRSADRRSKEQAMHDKFSRRIEAALARLAARIARSSKRLDREQVDRQIGRILHQNQRAARRFKVRLAEDGGPAGFRLEVEVNAAFDDWAALSEGAYLLRSNITDWSDEQLWKAYIRIAVRGEAAFRIKKDQLRVRPIWHQRADRVEAHILVCFLAFVLWKTLEMWQSRAGLGNAPRTVLEELARIQSHDVVLPTASHGQIRLRCVTQPDPAQAALLDRLGIVLPKRMRLAEAELPAMLLTA